MKRFVKSIFRKKRKNESRLKYISYLLHLWLGLLSSVVVFTLCVSGCIYAFKNQIADLYNYDKVFITADANTPNPDDIVKIFKEKKREIISVTIPEDRGRSWSISYNDGGATKGTYYNPYSGAELGSGDQGLDSFFEFILDLHRNLLMGNVGRQINGVCVLIFLGLLLSGFILWLPKKLKYLKQNLTVKTSAKFPRLNHDLHNVLGFYAMIFLAFIAITGLYITYPWVKNAIFVTLGGEPISEQVKQDNAQDDSFANLMNDMLERQNEKSSVQNATVTLSKLIGDAEKHAPGKGSITITYPTADDPRYNVVKTSNNNLLKAIVPDEMSFDKNGVLKTKEVFTEKPLHKQFAALAKPLHTGEIMGLSSIIFYFIITLIGAMLPVTGFIIWYHRFVKIK